VLRQGQSEFTFQDAISASKLLSSRIAPAEEVAPQVVGDVFDLLVQEEYLQVVQRSLAEVQVGDLESGAEKRYRLTPRRLTEMSALADAFEEEVYVVGPEAPGLEQVGEYSILSDVGSGGMSRVYRAWDNVRGREVALKVLSTALLSNPIAVQRFRREGQVLSALRHPNIVHYYEIGEDRGFWFIAMEYVHGSSLASVIQQAGRVSSEVAVAIARPAADALQYVHEQGFVRNDVKPGNILVSTGGRVLVTDFGISKALEAESDMTSTGELVGTPYYMSPEQCRGEQMDGRADIYALGAVMYEMITGRPPFRGKSTLDVVRAHIYDAPVSPSEHVELPAALEKIILRCLEKDPVDRFQSMGELKEGLDSLTADVPSVDLAPVVESVLEQVQAEESREEIHTQVILAPVPAEEESRRYEVALEMPAQKEEWMANGMLPIWRGQRDTIFAASPAGVCLQPVDTEGKPVGGRLELDTGSTLLGRAGNNDIVVNDVKASRHHAEIVCEGKRCSIEDLNTANGTLVNGQRVLKRTRLDDGDVITVGGIQLVFQVLADDVPTD